VKTFVDKDKSCVKCSAAVGHNDIIELVTEGVDWNGWMDGIISGCAASGFPLDDKDIYVLSLVEMAVLHYMRFRSG
jgi:hypothetical protein